MALSKSALFYRNNKASRDKKKAYDTEFGKSPERRAYRSRLSVERKKRGLTHDPRDLSHTRSGKLVLENRKRNRQRNGADGRSTLK